MTNDSPSLLNQRLAELGSEEFGWVEGQGMFATECSPHNKKAREKLREWMGAEGLEVTTDKAGNIIGILKPEGCDPQAAPLIIGSHIDTVPNGGRYDGRYGVLAGLQVVHNLQAEGAKINRPIVVAAWTGEESAYFQPAMPGSHATTHPDETDAVLKKCTAINGPLKGTNLQDALDSIGETGATRPGFFLDGVDLSKANYLEAHIEQGKLLEDKHQWIGVVTHVYGVSQSDITIEANSPSANVAQAVAELTQFVNKRVENDEHERGTVGIIKAEKSVQVSQPAFEITFHGEADHAGGRPMIGRHDAAYAASSLVERMGGEIITENLTLPNGGINRVPDQAVLTVRPPEGMAEAEWLEKVKATAQSLVEERGVTLEEPRKVSSYEKMTAAKVTTDKRDIRPDHIGKSERALQGCIDEISRKYGVKVKQVQGTQEAPVPFDKEMRKVVRASAEEQVRKRMERDGEAGNPGDKVREMPSGPFHDSMKFGAIMPATMVFVPSHLGISHDKAEFSDPKDLDLGADVLTSAARKLACDLAVEKSSAERWATSRGGSHIGR